MKNSKAVRLPDSAGELLVHLEAAGAADDWTIDTDPANPADLTAKLRRTFRLKALGDAECAVVVEFGHPFIILGPDFYCLLADIFAPLPLSQVIAEKQWATPDMLVFVAVLERLFPREVFGNTTRV